MNQKRACIYPKDIQGITGRSERYGRKLIHDLEFIQIKDLINSLKYKSFLSVQVSIGGC